MLKAQLVSDEGDSLLVLGIDKENVKRLKEGDPIYFDLKPYGLNGKLLLYYGKDTNELKQILEDKLGCLLPEISTEEKGH